jgi:hypothetical protein
MGADSSQKSADLGLICRFDTALTQEQAIVCQPDRRTPYPFSDSNPFNPTYNWLLTTRLLLLTILKMVSILKIITILKV